MNNRVWFIGSAVLGAAVIALGWFLGIAPQLAQLSSTDDQILAAETINASHEAEIAALRIRYEGIDEVRSQLDALRSSLPDNADMDSFIRQIAATADVNLVNVTAFTAGDANSFLPTGVDVPVAETTVPADDSGAAPAAVSPDNFIVIPVSFTVEGGYDNVLAYINGLQSGDRLLSVTSLSITKNVAAPAAKGAAADQATSTGLVAGLIYVLLDPATSGAVPQPSGTETPAAAAAQ